MDLCTEVASAWRPRRDPPFGRADGGGQPHLGLHADPRCAEECRASRRAVDDCARPQSPRAPAGSGPADGMADLPPSHQDVIASADFFTTEVWTCRGLLTMYTVFCDPSRVPSRADSGIDRRTQTRRSCARLDAP